MQAVEPAKSGLQLGANEHLYMRLRPHPLAFFRYYVTGIMVIIWAIVVWWMHREGWLTFDFLNDDVNALLPALVIALGAVLLGLVLLSRFGRLFQGLFWFALIALVVVSGLYIWYWGDPDFAPTFAILYGILMGVVAILVAAIYNRAFNYYITNQRVVLRYKMFSMEENTLRFEKIEDFKIERSLGFRILGLGVIRAYTGTEDGKYDPDRSYDSPTECIYGIRHPVEVKQMLIEIVLERDQHSERMVDMLEKQTEGITHKPAPEPEPIPEPEPVPEPAAATGVAYYQPAPPPEPEPQPSRNYERIDPAQYAPPAMQAMSPPPPSHEHTEQTPPSPVRKMYPEAREPAPEFALEGGDDMDFQRSSASRPPSGPRYRTVEEDDDPDREVYDEKKPKAL